MDEIDIPPVHPIEREQLREESTLVVTVTSSEEFHDVKNVHEELSRLAPLDIVLFEEERQHKRPVVWFDELVS